MLLLFLVLLDDACAPVGGNLLMLLLAHVLLVELDDEGNLVFFGDDTTKLGLLFLAALKMPKTTLGLRCGTPSGFLLTGNGQGPVSRQLEGESDEFAY